MVRLMHAIGWISKLPVDQHLAKLGVWNAERFDQVLEALVIFKLEAEGGVLTVIR